MRRRPEAPGLWWPAAVAALALLAGLLWLALAPGPEAAAVQILTLAERSDPIPGDPTADRLVDLNRASRAELEALPGIGEERAAAILAAREAGPFASLAEVEEREVLPLEVLLALEGWATARPPVGGDAR